MSELQDAVDILRTRTKQQKQVTHVTSVRECSVNQPEKIEKPKRLDHLATIEKNKKEVQVLVVERYQWYSMTVGKIFSMNEGREVIDWIYEDGMAKGIKPFVNRPLRTEKEPDVNIIRRPIVKPTRHAKTIEWFIPWRHHAKVPGFITYSSLPFQRGDTWYRLIDVDYEANGRSQIQNYTSGNRFGEFYTTICEHNLVAEKMERTPVNEFQGILKEISASIIDKIGAENICREPTYTGRGFRILLQNHDKEKMAAKIRELIDADLICSSSTIGYQPMRICSAQTMAPHFQTDMSPNSKNFKFSNPAFFFCRYNDDIIKGLFEYPKTYTINSYEEETQQGDIYQEMRRKQIEIEGQLIPKILDAS